MAISLKTRFGILATAMLLLPSVVFAEPASFTTATTTILNDADRAAVQWVDANPNTLAVPVHIGQNTKVPTKTVVKVLRKDFEAQGITNVRFFYEKGGSGDTTVAYVTRNHVWGPYALGRARDFVTEAAKQHKFEMKRELN